MLLGEELGDPTFELGDAGTDRQVRGAEHVDDGLDLAFVVDGPGVREPPLRSVAQDAPISGEAGESVMSAPSRCQPPPGGVGPIRSASMASRNATAALLWAACRPEPDGAGVAAAVASGADLQVAANAALAQRLSPLLWRALRNAEIPTDASWAEAVHADAQRCRAQALLLLPRIGTAALVPLAEADLEPLVLKGAALANRYPEPGLRPMTDVDLLLPAAHHRRAISVLAGAGWRVASIPGGGHYETALRHPDLPGLPLELHRGLAMWRERSGGPTARELWRRRRPTVVAGAPAFGLEPEDELLALAAHAGKPFHGFSRLLWITDLVVVTDAARASGRPIDWDRVGFEARRRRCATVLAVALSQAARLGLESPKALQTPPGGSASRRRVVEALLAEEWPVIELDERVRYQLRFALADGPIRRLALRAGALTADGMSALPGRLLQSITRRRERRPPSRATSR